MKNRFFLGIVILPLTIFAQNITPNVLKTIDVNLQVQKNRGEVYDQYVDVEGSPYMEDAFLPAMLYPDEKLYLARYNAKDDEIEVNLGENGILVLDNSRRDYKMVFKDSGLTYLTLHGDGIRLSGYFIEVSSADKVSVYKKQVKRYFPGKKATDNFSKNQNAYFSTPKEVYYIQLGNGTLEEIPKSRNSFAKLFGSKEDAIKNFIKKNKIDLENEEDIKKVVAFIVSK